jgi:hypothetical protein
MHSPTIFPEIFIEYTTCMRNKIQDGKIPFIGEVINMDEDKIMME